MSAVKAWLAFALELVVAFRETLSRIEAGHAETWIGCAVVVRQALLAVETHESVATLARIVHSVD